MSRVPTAVVIVIVSALVSANALPFAGRADVIRILRTERFEILRDPRKIPDEDLRSAEVIPRGGPLVLLQLIRINRLMVQTRLWMLPSWASSLLPE